MTQAATEELRETKARTGGKYAKFREATASGVDAFCTAFPDQGEVLTKRFRNLKRAWEETFDYLQHNDPAFQAAFKTTPSETDYKRVKEIVVPLAIAACHVLAVLEDQVSAVEDRLGGGKGRPSAAYKEPAVPESKPVHVPPANKPGKPVESAVAPAGKPVESAVAPTGKPVKAEDF